MAAFHAVLLTLLAGLGCAWAATCIIKENCLACMCARNDCNERANKAPTDGVCGPFYISEPYFDLSQTTDQPYLPCTQGMKCSQQVVCNFMALYAAVCTAPAAPTCADFAGMHWASANNTLACKPLSVPWREDGRLSSIQDVMTCCDILGGCD